MTQPWHGSLRGTLPTLVLLLAAMLLAPPAHATTGSLTDTTVADFNAGGPGTDTYLAETGDGEVMSDSDRRGRVLRLCHAGRVVEHPYRERRCRDRAGWRAAGGRRARRCRSRPRAGPIARVRGDLRQPSRLRAPASATSLHRQHGGRCSARWTRARTSTPARTSELGPPSTRSSPGRSWVRHIATASTGTSRASTSSSTAPWSPYIRPPRHRACRPLRRDEQLGGESIALDWLRISPYTATGSFLSRVLDAGRRVDWEALSWTHESPAGTVVFLGARTGDTPTPGRDLDLVCPGRCLGRPGRWQLPLRPVSRRPHVERSRTDPGP